MTDIGPYELDTIVVGDCLDVMRAMPDGCVDLVVTSPPYFNTRPYAFYSSYADYLLLLEKWLKRMGSVVKNGRPIVVNVSCVIEPRTCRATESIRHPIPFDCVFIARQLGLALVDDIIWQKPDGASSRAIKFAHHRRPVAYKPFQVTEYVLVFRDKSSGLLDRVIQEHTKQQIEASLVPDGYERTNVWSICPARDSLHPAPFPLSLAEKTVQYYSFVGDVIFDPFMGSGTTAVAAKKLGRHYFGCDISAEYVELARKRVAKIDGVQLGLGV